MLRVGRTRWTAWLKSMKCSSSLTESSSAVFFARFVALGQASVSSAFLFFSLFLHCQHFGEIFDHCHCRAANISCVSSCVQHDQILVQMTRVSKNHSLPYHSQYGYGYDEHAYAYEQETCPGDNDQSSVKERQGVSSLQHRL